MRKPHPYKETLGVLEEHYCKKDPSWQEDADSDGSRTKMFACLFRALENEGVFGETETNKTVYFPAANEQLETRVFSSLGKCYKNVSFVGGDIVRETVHKGKEKMPEDSTAEFVVANAFCLPFQKLDAIIDVGGATAYSFFKVTSKEEHDCETGGFESILCEYHRCLKPDGLVILDDRQCSKPHSTISTMRLIEVLRPEKFKEMMGGRLYVLGEDGYVAKFDVKPLALGSGRNAYALKKM